MISHSKEIDKEKLKELRVKFNVAMPRTPMEKYYYMSRINPALSSLAEKFNLKFE